MVNLLILIAPLAFSMVAGELDVAYEWKYIDYEWEDSSQKQTAIDSGDYNYTQIFTIDVDRARDGRVFVTTPRQVGVPATLSTVCDQKSGEGGPLLKPYPNWSWNQKTDCTGITSVYRVAIDDCNKLWVLDTGNDGSAQVCPAQLLVFDLSNDRLIRRITIPSDYASVNGKGLLITPALETHGPHCERTKVYMADSDGPGLVVYNGREFHRFSNPSFDPEEEHSTFTIAGESFYLADGVFSLAVQPRKPFSQSSRLFYRPLASLKQYYVSTRNLEENFHRSMTPNYRTIDYTFPAQVTAQAFSHRGILFMGYTNPPAIACWDSSKTMNDDNVVIIAQDEEKLQFTSGLKVKGHELLVFTNRFQKIMDGTQNFDEVNFRILIEPDIYHLIRHTTCSQH